MRHDPTLCRTGRHGCWATCTCGWESGLFTTVSGAHQAFGEHLLDGLPDIDATTDLDTQETR